MTDGSRGTLEALIATLGDQVSAERQAIVDGKLEHLPELGAAREATMGAVLALLGGGRVEDPRLRAQLCAIQETASGSLAILLALRDELGVALAQGQHAQRALTGYATAG